MSIFGKGVPENNLSAGTVEHIDDGLMSIDGVEVHEATADIMDDVKRQMRDIV